MGTRAPLEVGPGDLGRVRKADLVIRSKATFPSLLPVIATHSVRLLKNVVTVKVKSQDGHLVSCGQLKYEWWIYFYSSVICFTLKPFFALVILASWTFSHPSDKEGSSAPTTSM